MLVWKSVSLDVLTHLCLFIMRDLRKTAQQLGDCWYTGKCVHLLGKSLLDFGEEWMEVIVERLKNLVLLLTISYA